MQRLGKIMGEAEVFDDLAHRTQHSETTASNLSTGNNNQHGRELVGKRRIGKEMDANKVFDILPQSGNSIVDKVFDELHQSGNSRKSFIGGANNGRKVMVWQAIENEELQKRSNTTRLLGRDVVQSGKVDGQEVAANFSSTDGRDQGASDGDCNGGPCSSSSSPNQELGNQVHWIEALDAMVQNRFNSLALQQIDPSFEGESSGAMVAQGADPQQEIVTNIAADLGGNMGTCSTYLTTPAGQITETIGAAPWEANQGTFNSDLARVQGRIVEHREEVQGSAASVMQQVDQVALDEGMRTVETLDAAKLRCVGGTDLGGPDAEYYEQVLPNDEGSKVLENEGNICLVAERDISALSCSAVASQQVASFQNRLEQVVPDAISASKPVLGDKLCGEVGTSADNGLTPGGQNRRLDYKKGLDVNSFIKDIEAMRQKIDKADSTTIARIAASPSTKVFLRDQLQRRSFSPLPMTDLMEAH
ncbi:hypothetical protein LIER_41367 [Lithospermum erythrorhizon]|uniref:Uncharacterized protein n=1 Tax=Lithospermum erythrorhizon TaxID=34254 RepID=A0AAV3RBX7_LITER